ncbi:MAG: sodium:solute symporter family protein [Peptococcaceae bacterium]
MNAYGYWMFGLAIAYTVLLITMSQIAKKKAKQGEDFWVGGRSFSRWTVAFCITGLFSGSTFISILELSYLKGVSSMWYGVAELSHVLIIALVLIGPFRKKMMVTVSGLIGDKYGRWAKGIAGAITAFTFPMWSVATALAFASCINALTGLNLMVSVIITAALLYVFLQAGGMYSVALTQTANFFAFLLMFAIGFYAFVLNPGFDGLAELALQKPELFALDTVGLQQILAWFGTFWINVLLAQAAFQMALSCKTAEEGRKGLFIAAGFNVVFIVMGVIIGLAATTAVPGVARGLVAVPTYLMQTLPAPLVGLFTLGIWACALGWGAPCQFSGATSLGKDVGIALNPRATDADLVKYTKWSLALLTGLMVIFGFLRSEQAAWWNIFAWTARNGATFAPVVTALFWPLAKRRGAVSALIAGFAAGLLWNHLGGWAVNNFYLNTHPVWVAMTANIITMTIFSLAEGNWRFTKDVGSRKNVGYIGLGGAVVFLLTSIYKFTWLFQNGLLGMFLFLAVLGIWLMTMAFTVSATEELDSDNAAAQTV